MAEHFNPSKITNLQQDTYLHGEHFVFASECVFATTYSSQSTSETGSPIGTINIYPHGSIAVHTSRIASFSLPEAAGGTSCRIKLAYTPSIHKSNSPHAIPPKIFDLAPNQQWLQLGLRIIDRGSHLPDLVMLYVAFGALLDMVSSITANTKGPTVHFPWDSWAKHTAWFAQSESIFHSSGCVYGSRASYLTGEGTETKRYTLTILDLSLRGTRSATQHSVDHLATPADDYAQSVLRGSRRPTVITSFDLKDEIFGWRDGEQVPEVYLVVMMDEDHCKLNFLPKYKVFTGSLS